MLKTLAVMVPAVVEQRAVAPVPLLMQAEPTVVKVERGLVVPMPTLPLEKMVSFAASEGPIIVEEAVLLVILEPMAMAPCTEAILL